MASVYKRTWTSADNRERVRVAAYKDQDGRRHYKGFKIRAAQAMEEVA